METENRQSELNERARQNLQRNAQLRNNGSNKYFTPQYTVKDPNTGQEKYWTVSKRTSEQIDAFLSGGHDLLKIQRFGLGKDTRYHIIPS
jgi:hypothetical protein